MKLKGKAALVTGSSRGIGRAVALRFAKEGARVAIHALSRRDKAEAVASEIRAAGGEAAVLIGDVSKKKDAEALVAGTIAAFGALDILVSNAGIVIDRPFVESTDEDWSRAISTNLTGFFNMV